MRVERYGLGPECRGTACRTLLSIGEQGCRVRQAVRLQPCRNESLPLPCHSKRSATHPGNPREGAEGLQHYFQPRVGVFPVRSAFFSVGLCSSCSGLTFCYYPPVANL